MTGTDPDVVEALPDTPIPETQVTGLAESEAVGLAKPVAYHHYADHDDDLVSALVLGVGEEYYPLGFNRQEMEWRIVASPVQSEEEATDAVMDWQEAYYGIDR